MYSCDQTIYELSKSLNRLYLASPRGFVLSIRFTTSFLPLKSLLIQLNIYVLCALFWLMQLILKRDWGHMVASAGYDHFKQ